VRNRIWLIVTLAVGGLIGALAGGAAARPAHAAGGITVYRDHYGVPHVEAQDLQGLAYATGYLTARDRLFEMDVIRKLGQGRLSELLPAFLPMDRVVRREFLLQTDIDGQYAALSPQMKSMYEAYSAGVNRGAIETLATKTPTLMVALGDPWEPWTPRDSVIVDMVFTEVTFGGEGAAGQLENATLLAHLQRLYGPDEGMRAFNDLVPPSYPDAPTVIPRGDGPPAPSGAGYDTTGPAVSQQPLVHLGGLATAAAAQANELATVRNLITQYHIPLPRIGSYGVAISGSRTASHGGLLLGSPQSGLLAPPIFYEIGWHIPGVTDCEGFTVPGLGPAIGIGWCNQHAWTLVAGNMGDQTDLYVERLDPQNPHRYWFDGTWHDTVQRTTTYIVKGTATCPPAKGIPAGPCLPPQVVTETYDYTVHGAINAVDKADSVGFAYRRAQNGVFLRSLYGSAGWNLAHDMNGVMSATDAFTATYNMLYADSDGHIAYRFTGLQPVRPGTDRRFPVPGSGETEWLGYLNQCQMPHDTDPSVGYFAVNQGTESKSISWWPDAPAVGVGVASRVGHDQELVAGLRPATMEGLRALNKHLLEEDDPYAAVFYPLFAHALQGSSDPRLQQALAQLDAWRADGFSRTDRDNDNLEDHPGLAIFELDNINYSPPDDGFQVPLGDALIAAILGPPTGDHPLGTYNAQLSTVYEVLTGHTAHRFVDDPDALIRTTLSQVLDKLTRQYGTSDMSRWHQPFPKEPFLALSAIGPAPVKGMDHGSYSQIVDLGTATGENVEPPGNIAADSAVDTAQVAGGYPPAHFEDQRDLYESYQFKPMRNTAAQYRPDPEAVISLDDGGGFGSDTGVDYTFHRDPCRNGVAAGTSTVAAPAASALPSTAPAPLAPAGGAATALLVAGLAGRRHRKRRRTA